jgi:hypothetical protein
VTEHPRYRMWKDLLEREEAIERARAERRAARELERTSWYAAWNSYKQRRSAVSVRGPLPRWWNVLGWIRWLLRLHAPGRRG